jgi:cyclophilin family peptidyl-prolyl cis-trans isomerase
MGHMPHFCLVVAAVLIASVPGQIKAKVDAADHVTLTTDYGKIVIRLRTDVAPKSSAMFADLVSSGLYNGCSFYRAEDFCIQGGLRTAAGEVRKNPLGHFPYEYGLANKRGTVTFARWQDVNSATGEFFINLKDSPHLDRTGTTGWSLGFAVFGEVEAGMDVVEKIAKLPTLSQGGMSMLTAPVTFQTQAEAVAPTVPHADAPVALMSSASRINIDIQQLGTVPVDLLPENAPKMVAALQSLVQRGASGSMHRAEGIPAPPSEGPPYSLVQSTIHDPDGILVKMPHEGSLPIQRGSVCMISGSSDFFISLGDHRGWEGSMTVFGQVEPQIILQRVMPILERPHHNFKHPTFGTVMSMLDTPLAFRLSIAEGGALMQPVDSEEAKLNAAEAATEAIERDAGNMLRGMSSYSLYKDL